MKNKILNFLAVTAAFCTVLLFVMGTKGLSWYTVPTKNGERPTNFESEEMLKKYGAIYIGNADEKTVYLTFDAGYENGNVAKTLDILKKHDVKAAFFILPHLVSANTELVLRMTNEGHLVCNHTYSHRDMSKVTDKESFSQELTKLEKVYADTTGLTMAKYFRPPEGSFSEENLKFADELGYRTVFWSLAYADWDNNKQMAPERAKELILSRMHNGCVVLLHPTSSTNAAILDELISELKAQGYKFETLDNFR